MGAVAGCAQSQWTYMCPMQGPELACSVDASRQRPDLRLHMTATNSTSVHCSTSVRCTSASNHKDLADLSKSKELMQFFSGTDAATGRSGDGAAALCR